MKIMSYVFTCFGVVFCTVVPQLLGAQSTVNLTETEGFETFGSAFTPSSPLAYDRTNVKPEGHLTLGLWYEQAEGVSASLGISQDKLFGTDEEFRLNLEASRYTQTGQITLTDPDFFESDYSRQLSFSAYNIRPNQTQNGSYSFSGAEASIGFGRQLTDDLSFSFGAGIAYSEIEDDPNLPTFIQDYISLEGDERTTVFGFANFVFDRTDGGPNPRNGYRFGFANELGFVSDTTYLKSEVKAAYFKQATARTGVKVHGNLALGDTLGSGTFPIYENYFAGGPNSVRGYASNTLGPTSTIPNETDLAYAGGKMRLIGGVELSTQVGNRDDLAVLGFVDVGNVFAEIEDFTASGLRSSIGVGVRWDTPIGPLNVYLSHALNDEPEDDLEMLQFTLGARF
jgi:outer membrane protein assembly complex protein YaeT